jgi:ABC-type multidrug transport system ATPase subunit
MGVSFGPNQVLKSATVWAHPGQVTVIMGRNGSGKTTLFRAALGLVRREFGVVRFGDRVHETPRLSRLSREGLFFLPDRDALSRRRDLAWHFAALRHQFRSEARPDVPEALRTGELVDKESWEMSAGERRRAGVSLAWVRGPRCLLADEPLAGLEPKDQGVVAGLVRAMADDGCAVIATGHDVRPLFDVADEIVWMVAGTTHGIGSSDDARAHDQFRREYLGPAR